MDVKYAIFLERKFPSSSDGKIRSPGERSKHVLTFDGNFLSPGERRWKSVGPNEKDGATDGVTRLLANSVG